MPSHYQIIDIQTGALVATAKTRKGATRAVDQRDRAWGGYRYSARPVWGVAS